jgi:hypothetical protein
LKLSYEDKDLIKTAKSVNARFAQRKISDELKE